MTKQSQIYKCEVCGNIIEVLHTGAGELVCCGQPMKLQEEKKEEEGNEKHLPVIEILPANVCQGGDGAVVKIGATEHPMEDKHYIEWIEIITADNKRGKKFLQPGDTPQVEFHTRAKIIGARAYCNVHGLWEMRIEQ